MIAPSDCKHQGALFIARENSTSNVYYSKHASVCPHCGTFIVWINGERMTFWLVSDEQVAAAGVYASSLAPSQAQDGQNE